MTLRPLTTAPARRAVALAALLLVGALVPAGLGLSASAGALPSTVPASHPTTPGSDLSAAPTSRAAPPVSVPTNPSSGRGVFFDSVNLSNPPSANDACAYYSTCMNDTGNPSITSTSAGVIAVAYTALADYTSCPGQASSIYSEIGVNVSKNGGTTWGPTVYLDNPNCTGQPEYDLTSAMMPSIAALSNGTLVLAYIEYSASAVSSCTAGQYAWWPSLAPCYVTNDSLVITYSYNDGATWATPTVLNSTSNTALNQTSWMAAEPEVATFGSTIYVAWSNWTYPDLTSYSIDPSIGLNLVVSNDSGATWGAPTTLPVTPGVWQGLPTWIAYSPHLAVSPSGELFVTYATNFEEDTATYCDAYGCAPLGYIGNEGTLDVVVARSTNNGSTFAVATVAAGVPMIWNGFTWIWSGPGSIFAPAPEITIDPTTGELLVTYSGGLVGQVCFTYGCYTEEAFEAAYVATSTNGGLTWSTPVLLGGNWLGANGAATGEEYLITPSVAVAGNGTVYVNAVFSNDSVCVVYTCDLWTDLIFESTDNGSTFDSGYLAYPGGTIFGYPLWDGFDTATTVLNGTPFMAWTLMDCPGGGTIYCSQPSTLSCWTQVMVTSPFVGVGVNVTFNETGLPSGLSWTADLSGNLRSGLAGTNLTVSGVPTGYLEVWSAPWVATATWGVQYASSFPGGTSGLFAASTGIAVDFDKVVRLDVTTVPPGYPGWAFSCVPGTTFADYCANQAITPSPGVSWVPVGTPMSYSVTPVAFPSYCYYCQNLSFVSWTAVGAGGWTTTSPNGTATITAPANESANFNLLNVCDAGICTNITYGYSFTETGLPSGTNWTVTLGGQVAWSTGAVIGFNATQGPLNFTIWTIPYNGTESYVGVPSVPSPIGPFQGGQEVVTFSLENNSHVTDAVTASATGLPAGVASWGLELGVTSYAVPLGTSTFDLTSGSVTLNASDVYGPNGVGGYPTGFTVTPEVVGASTFSVPLGGAFDLTGPTLLTASYAPLYALNVSHSVGGTVTGPSNTWVASGGSVNLTAVPAPGYAFLGWSGSGDGAVASSALSITVHVGGPVDELATFAAVVPTYQLNVTASGLPSGIPISVTVGTESITAAPPFSITGLTAGSYAVSVPTVYPNATAGVRYPTSSLRSSLPLNDGSIDVTGNGSLSVTFVTQYTLTVGAASNGAASLAPGSYWEPGGVPVTLTALPSPGYISVGWTGSGIGAVTSPNASVTVTPTAPIAETPSFALYVAPPPLTYTLTLTETGLPTGTTWSATVSGHGTAGTGALALNGLNGSVEVLVPIVSGGAGVRYVPASLQFPEDVTGNASANVVFTTQYYVSITASTGGTVSLASTWANASATLALTATPATGYTFAGWTGTGTGSSSAATASTSVTVSAPITEQASFVPIPPAPTSSSSGGAGTYALPIGLLVALLVVGLVIGLVLGRRGGGRPLSPAEAETPVAPTPEAAPEPTPSEPSSGADYSEGEETLYGGGAGGN